MQIKSVFRNIYIKLATAGLYMCNTFFPLSLSYLSPYLAFNYSFLLRSVVPNRYFLLGLLKQDSRRGRILGGRAFLKIMKSYRKNVCFQPHPQHTHTHTHTHKVKEGKERKAKQSKAKQGKGREGRGGEGRGKENVHSNAWKFKPSC